MKAKMTISFLLLGMVLQVNAQHLAVDGGVIYKHETWNSGKNYSAFLGSAFGISKKLTPHLEARLGFQLLFFESFPIWGKTGNTWFSSRYFPGSDALRAWQSELRLSWRPSGYEEGPFTGMGFGRAVDKYYVYHDRNGNPSMGFNGDLGKSFVLTGHLGYDLKILKGNSLRFQSEAAYHLNGFWMGSFGLGWRWAGKVVIPQPKGRG